MNTRHLFILDTLSALNYDLDTSIRLAHALQTIGEEVYFCSIFDISTLAEGESVRIHCRKFENFGNWGKRQVSVAPMLEMCLRDFSTVHMRKDPPFDLAYISACWILGREVYRSKKPKVRILNHPHSIVHFNEKLLSFEFKQLSVPGILTGSVDQIVEFVVKDSAEKFIMKPLHLFGGHGVEKLDTRGLNPVTLQTAVEDFVKLHGFVIVQRFLETITEVGEIRGFFAGGKAVAWCLKKPKAGEYLANTRAGATLHTWSPTVSFCRDLESMAEELWVQHGIYFIGVDIIGDKVSEINITSPRLLLAPEDREKEESIFLKIAKDLISL